MRFSSPEEILRLPEMAQIFFGGTAEYRVNGSHI